MAFARMTPRAGAKRVVRLPMPLPSTATTNDRRGLAPIPALMLVCSGNSLRDTGTAPRQVSTCELLCFLAGCSWVWGVLARPLFEHHVGDTGMLPAPLLSLFQLPYQGYTALFFGSCYIEGTRCSCPGGVGSQHHVALAAIFSLFTADATTKHSKPQKLSALGKIDARGDAPLPGPAKYGWGHGAAAGRKGGGALPLPPAATLCGGADSRKLACSFLATIPSRDAGERSPHGTTDPSDEVLLGFAAGAGDCSRTIPAERRLLIAWRHRRCPSCGHRPDAISPRPVPG